MARKKMKPPTRLQILRWISPLQLYLQRVSDLLKEPSAVAYVTPEFLADLSSYQRRLTGYAYKLSLTSIVLLAVLFLNLKVQSTNVSILGVSPNDIKPLKEIVSTLASVLSLLAVYISLQRDYVLALLKASIDATLPIAQRELAYRRFGLDELSLPLNVTSADGKLTPNRSWVIGVSITFIFISIVFIVLFIVSLLLSLWILIDIHQYPTFGPILTYGFIAFIGICNLASLLLVIFLGKLPMPFWDNSRALELRELLETDRAAFLRKYDEYSKQDGQSADH